MPETKLMKRLGYQFQTPALLKLALTHRSVSKQHNNERMEFLGDAELEQVISIQLYEQFPAASEGQLTRMRARLVRGKTLAEMAAEMGLGEFLYLGSGEMKSGGFRRESILADAFEAIIGAVLLDGGPAVCRERLLAWFAPRLAAISPDQVDKDAKTRLQEWLQGRRHVLPEYTLDEAVGQPPDQVFYITCHLTEHDQAFTANGSSRRRAEQKTAAKALDWLETSHAE